MTIAFYITAAIALLCTVRVITNTNATHALLYFVVSLLAVALLFYMLGASFVAALEVIIYAGAILVLFIFVIMLLNFGDDQARQERGWLSKRFWAGPGVLCALLLGITSWVVLDTNTMPSVPIPVTPQDVGVALFGPYLIGVQLAALLLLSGLIGASHLRRHERSISMREIEAKAQRKEETT